jgi:YD repeat-containing protein
MIRHIESSVADRELRQAPERRKGGGQKCLIVSGDIETMVYDAASRETSTTDFDGRITTISYDNMNRETGEIWKASGTTTDTLTFTFDATGDLLTAANSAGVYTMAYDNLNRMTSIQEPFSLTLTYAYDAAGHETTTTDSFGGTLTSV